MHYLSRSSTKLVLNNLNQPLVATFLRHFTVIVQFHGRGPNTLRLTIYSLSIYRFTGTYSVPVGSTNQNSLLVIGGSWSNFPALEIVLKTPTH